MMYKEPQILIANGVNLDLLGKRKKEHYGNKSLKEIEGFLALEKKKLANISGFPDCHLFWHQTNDEKTYIELLNSKFDAAILNPGAWTHTSLALADRLEALEIIFVETHLSQINTRETIRRKSLITPYAKGTVCGFQENSYSMALFSLLKILSLSR